MNTATRMRQLPLARICASLAIVALLAYPLAGPVLAEEVDEKTLEQGRTLFTETAEPQCAICHVLADADAEGPIGPDLDREQPDFEQIRIVVRDGSGPMPAYGDILSDEEIDAVAHYVATVAGQ